MFSHERLQRSNKIKPKRTRHAAAFRLKAIEAEHSCIGSAARAFDRASKRTAHRPGAGCYPHLACGLAAEQYHPEQADWPRKACRPKPCSGTFHPERGIAGISSLRRHSCPKFVPFDSGAQGTILTQFRHPIGAVLAR